MHESDRAQSPEGPDATAEAVSPPRQVANRLWKNDIVAALLSQPRHLLVLRLTLLLLLFYGSSSVALDIPLQILCGIMLISPRLVMNQTLWVLVCAVVWWVNAKDWLWIDNHKFLISYWCLVCALAVSSRDPDAVLAWNGRWLVGLAFFFATLWKALGGEYWDGSFLHVTFLSDSRVEAIASFIGDLPPSALAENYRRITALEQLPQLLKSVPLISSPRLERFTQLASYWTLLIEGSVAIAFLLNGIRGLGRWRDMLLMTFIVTTYYLLPVLGFAYVLAIMGFAQCPIDKSKTRLAYLVIIMLLQLARLPLDRLLLTM